MVQNHGRKHARVNYSYLAKVTFSDQTRENFPIKDISLAGVFLLCENQFFEEEQCIIKLTEKWASTSYTYTIRGRVLRSTDQGVAIKFISMHPDTFMMLQTSLLYRCNDPLALGEEFAGSCPVILNEISDTQIATAILS